MGIRKCDCCSDGYLIVRQNSKTGEMFLGCTNYRRKGTGCRRTMNRDEYERSAAVTPEGYTHSPG